MFIKPVDHKLLNKFMWLLRNRGLWVERHSYSLRILYNNAIVGSLHIYPGFNEAVLRIFNVNKDSAEKLSHIVRTVFSELFPNYRLTIQLLVE